MNSKQRLFQKQSKMFQLNLRTITAQKEVFPGWEERMCVCVFSNFGPNANRNVCCCCFFFFNKANLDLVTWGPCSSGLRV